MPDAQGERDLRADVAVVGGGILGLATARALLLRRPALRLVVLEAEAEIAKHQTGRSSGVIHRGLYYAPGSLKARLCVEGAASLLRYCEEREIPFRLCGKVVVATTPAELSRLEGLYRRGLANGVPGLEVIGPERLRELEPHAAGLQALHSPQTGIVDFRLVAAAYADDVIAAGGEVRSGHRVHAIVRRRGRVLLRTSAADVDVAHAVACVGVNADRLAALDGRAREPRIVPFRGDYWVLRPRARHLARALVYPVPDPTFPFLGVHTTLRMDDSMWLGPNAVLAFARDGYRRWQARPRDLWDALAAPGFRSLARRHWRVGALETLRDWSRTLLVREARKLLPELRPRDVAPGPAGIRAQALAADGTLVDDFVFDGDERVVHVRNAPSPGATSSLAIGDAIAVRLERAWGIA
jgi:(S)-2-hydroxyglutarate dehydrogenase